MAKATKATKATKDAKTKAKKKPQPACALPFVLPYLAGKIREQEDLVVEQAVRLF